LALVRLLRVQQQELKRPVLLPRLQQVLSEQKQQAQLLQERKRQRQVPMLWLHHQRKPMVQIQSRVAANQLPGSVQNVFSLLFPL
jgi:hypothetical protein